MRRDFHSHFRSEEQNRYVNRGDVARVISGPLKSSCFYFIFLHSDPACMVGLTVIHGYKLSKSASAYLHGGGWQNSDQPLREQPSATESMSSFHQKQVQWKNGNF